MSVGASHAGRSLERAWRLVAAIAGVSCISLVIAAQGHLGWEYARPPLWEGLLLLSAIVLSLIGVRRLLRRLDSTRGEARFLLVIFVLFVVSRAAALRLIPSLPVSDFDSYVGLAREFAKCGPLPADREYFFAWGYSLFLAPIFRIAGDSFVVAKVLNVVLGAVAMPLIYAFALPAGVGVARASIVLYLLWPAQCFFTPVLASEHLALALVCGALALLRFEPARVWAGAGALLGCATAVRPALGVLAAAFSLLLLLGECGAKRRLVRFVALWCGLTLTLGGYLIVLKSLYGRAPESVAHWNLMVGLNVEAQGRWNAKDSEWFFALPPDERRGAALAQIRERLGQSPLTLARLAIKKQKLLWADNYYGLFWASQALAPGLAADRLNAWRPHLYAAGQIAHMVALALAATALLRVVRDGAPSTTRIAITLVLSGAILHGVFETQSRYSHVFAVGGIVLVASVIAPRSTGPNAAPAPQPPNSDHAARAQAR